MFNIILLDRLNYFQKVAHRIIQRDKKSGGEISMQTRPRIKAEPVFTNTSTMRAH